MALEIIYPPELKPVQVAFRELVRVTIQNYFESDEAEARIKNVLEKIQQEGGAGYG